VPAIYRPSCKATAFTEVIRLAVDVNNRAAGGLL
jgi:hypothetical protein